MSRRFVSANLARGSRAIEMEDLAHPLPENHPSIAVVCYVRHKKEPAPSINKALRHLSKCEVCQKAFDEEVQISIQKPIGRGWWTGDDRYLAAMFGTLK